MSKEGAEGARNGEEDPLGYRLHRGPEVRQWRQKRLGRLELEQALRGVASVAETLKGDKGGGPRA